MIYAIWVPLVGCFMVGSIARAHGKSAIVWALLALVVAFGSLWGSWRVLSAHLESAGFSYAWGALLLLLPLGSLVATGALATRQRSGASLARGSRFAMYRIEDEHHAGGACTLVVGQDHLALEASGAREAIGCADVVAARADSACLRLEWRCADGTVDSALLHPTGLASDGAGARMCASLAGRLAGFMATAP